MTLSHAAPFQVGDLQCHAIRDSDDLNCTVVYVQAAGRHILIDTGFGPMPPHGLLRQRLTALGCPPERIDTVLLTHADADHIGGTLDTAGELLFANARHLLSVEEHTFWAARPHRFQANRFFTEATTAWLNRTPNDCLQRLGGRLGLINEGTEIAPGIRVALAPGHTPGMLTTWLSSKGETLLHLGDIVYGIDLGEPDLAGGRVIGNDEWHSFVDHDPALALRTRDRVLADAERSGMRVFSAHAPFPGFGVVRRVDGRWRWQSV